MAANAAARASKSLRAQRLASWNDARAKLVAPTVVGSPRGNTKATVVSRFDLALTISDIALQSFLPYLQNSYANVAVSINRGEGFQPHINEKNQLLSQLTVNEENLCNHDASLVTSLMLVSEASQYSPLSVRSFAPAFNSSSGEPVDIDGLSNYNVLFNLKNYRHLVHATLVSTQVLDVNSVGSFCRSFIFTADIDDDELSQLSQPIPEYKGYKSTGSIALGGSGYVVENNKFYFDSTGSVSARRVVIIVGESNVDTVVRLVPMTPEQLWRTGRNSSFAAKPSDRQCFDRLGLSFVDGGGGGKDLCAWISTVSPLHFALTGQYDGLSKQDIIDHATLLQQHTKSYASHPLVLLEYVRSQAQEVLAAGSASTGSIQNINCTPEELDAVAIGATLLAFKKDSAEVTYLKTKFPGASILSASLRPDICQRVYGSLAHRLAEIDSSAVINPASELSKAWQSAFAEFTLGQQAGVFARYMTSQMLSYSGFAMLATIHAAVGGQSIGLTYACPPPPVVPVRLPIIASFYEPGHYFQLTGSKSTCSLSPITAVNVAQNALLELNWDILCARDSLGSSPVPPATKVSMDQLQKQNDALVAKTQSLTHERDEATKSALLSQAELSSLKRVTGSNLGTNGDANDCDVVLQCDKCKKKPTVTGSDLCADCSPVSTGLTTQFNLTCASCKSAFMAKKKFSKCPSCHKDGKTKTNQRTCIECKTKPTPRLKFSKCSDCFIASKKPSPISDKVEKQCDKCNCKFSPAHTKHRFCASCAQAVSKKPTKTASSVATTQAQPALSSPESKQLADLLKVMELMSSERVAAEAKAERESRAKEEAELKRAEALVASNREAECKRQAEIEEQRKKELLLAQQTAMAMYQQQLQHNYFSMVPPPALMNASLYPSQHVSNTLAFQNPVNPGFNQWQSSTIGYPMLSTLQHAPQQSYSVPYPSNRMMGYGMGMQ